MTWNEIDWPALDRLRAGFLDGTAATGPYWRTSADLTSYDFTYGKRIGWKWDAVLAELRLRGWRPPVGATVLDWGCGSGVAGRRVVEFFGAENFSQLRLWDHSPLACAFATEAAAIAFPTLDVASAGSALDTSSWPDRPSSPHASLDPTRPPAPPPASLLIVSHVLNELPPAALAELRALCERAAAVLWVEPGTHVVSRQLSALRDELRATFHLVAPCTHQNACPILAPENARDWCHHFAPPPSEIFAMPDWVKFGQRAGIDLRSLPYCFIALDRRPPAASENLSRIIGRPELFKPYARFLNCDATGLAELTLPRRTDPALYKQLDRSRAPLVYRWRRAADTVLAGEALSSHDAVPLVDPA